MEAATTPLGLEDELVRERGLRRRLEHAVAPLATSLDGRTFAFQAPISAPPAVGGHVVIATPSGERIGQIIDMAVSLRRGPELGLVLGEQGDGNGTAARSTLQLRVITGSGTLLSEPAGPFDDAGFETAEPDHLAAWLERITPPRAALPIGEAQLAPGVPIALDAGGFDRHTFLCGQSGSGKTYSLGVILERLLLETDLRIVVLDPNSDFVRLAEPHPQGDPALAERWKQAGRGIRVRRPAKAGDDRLRLRFAQLDPTAQAAMLRLDPIRDRDEYAALMELIDQVGARYAVQSLAEVLGPDATDAQRRLGLRVRNLGVLDWELWARNDSNGLIDELDEDDWRCLVVDLGTVSSPEERTVVADAVLQRLWERRTERRPVLVVIDEAHNVCPREPADPLVALSTEHTVRIAAEGRKYGIYLLISTQRPQKVHENILSQCDNLVLMRMNSTGDVAHLASLFSFVPQTLLARSTVFRQGESVIGGKLVSHPTLVRFGARVGAEGGGDVPTDWARPSG